MNGDDPRSDRGTDASTWEIHPDGGWSSLDEILAVLANQRRRYALYYLQDQTTATLREVSRQVRTWETENEAGTGTVPTDQIYMEFYHQHLPKLADANVVDYDPREELVRYDCPSLFEMVLDVLRWVEQPGDGSD